MLLASRHVLENRRCINKNIEEIEKNDKAKRIIVLEQGNTLTNQVLNTSEHGSVVSTYVDE